MRSETKQIVKFNGIEEETEISYFVDGEVCCRRTKTLDPARTVYLCINNGEFHSVFKQ
jgi:hypothetical protein